MPRNQKDSTYDHQLLLKDAGAVTTSGNGTVAAAARVIDLGASRCDFRVLVDVAAIDVADGNENYILQVQVSNSPSFANTVVAVASKQLGDSTVTGNTVDSVIGRYEIATSNEENGVVYRYLRIRHVLAGTTPSINYTAYAVKSTT